MDERDRQLRGNLSSLASHATEWQRQFMEGLTQREREPRNAETFVDEVEKFGATRQAAVKFLKALAAAGCGQFLAGRRQKRSRLAWEVKAKDAACAFLSYWSNAGATAEGLSDSRGQAIEALRSDFHKHRFLLRPGMEVSFDLPLDLTVEESVRLADFIRALPFRADELSSATYQETQS